ncbi:MAG: tetratricopeptide repeat protein [Planctomycetaceae bacterium]|nr:tetratricopeptide repeat protein [Planctomycetaceae bacterium]
MMRLARLQIGVFCSLAMLAAGCRLPGRDGPVPASLADCRRLAQQGAVALDRGDQPKAETLLSQAVEVCPVDAEARMHYAEALWRRGARQEAIAQLEEATRLTAEDASLWVRLAEMHLTVGQPELARSNAERALSLDAKLPSAWAIRGRVLRADGRLDEALADDLHALGYTPNDRALLAEIADLHRQLNQPDRALQTLQTLADTYPSNEEPSRVLYEIGLAQTALGRYDDAAESFASAAARGGSSPELVARLNEVRRLAGRSVQAAETACQRDEIAGQRR